ncbi:MAG: hypothetical protein CMM74_13610 [Rhodospirillaceae bacterium]|nr:hypothetical protein [Rhodospirillaceae bacterium]
MHRQRCQKIAALSISITKEKWTKTGSDVAVTISMAAIIEGKKKDGISKLSYYKTSYIFKNDRIARSFIKPVKAGWLFLTILGPSWPFSDVQQG